MSSKDFCADAFFDLNNDWADDLEDIELAERYILGFLPFMTQDECDGTVVPISNGWQEWVCVANNTVVDLDCDWILTVADVNKFWLYLQWTYSTDNFCGMYLCEQEPEECVEPDNYFENYFDINNDWAFWQDEFDQVVSTMFSWSGEWTICNENSEWVNSCDLNCDWEVTIMDVVMIQNVSNWERLLSSYPEFYECRTLCENDECTVTTEDIEDQMDINNNGVVSLADEWVQLSDYVVVWNDFCNTYDCDITCDWVVDIADIQIHTEYLLFIDNPEAAYDQYWVDQEYFENALSQCEEICAETTWVCGNWIVEVNEECDEWVFNWNGSSGCSNQCIRVAVTEIPNKF